MHWYLDLYNSYHRLQLDPLSVLHYSQFKILLIFFWSKKVAKKVSIIPSKLSSWWRHLEDVFRFCLQMKSSRHLHQDQYVCLSLTPSKNVYKTTEDIFKTSPTWVANTSWRRFQNVFKTYCKDVFRTSSWCFQDISVC